MGIETIPGNAEVDQDDGDIVASDPKSAEYFACKERFRDSWEKELESRFFDDFPYYERVKGYCRKYFYEEGKFKSEEDRQVAMKKDFKTLKEYQFKRHHWLYGKR